MKSAVLLPATPARIYQQRIQKRTIDVKTRRSEFRDDILQIDQPANIRSLENVESSNRRESLQFRGDSSTPLIHKNRRDMKFDCHRNRLSLASVEAQIERLTFEAPHFRPFGETRHKRSDNERCARVTQLRKNVTRNDHFAKQFWEQFDFTDEQEIIQRRGIGNNRPLCASNRSKLAASSRNSSTLSSITALCAFKNCSVAKKSNPNISPTCRLETSPERYPSSAIISKARRSESGPSRCSFRAIESGISSERVMAGIYHSGIVPATSVFNMQTRFNLRWSASCRWLTMRKSSNT